MVGSELLETGQLSKAIERVAEEVKAKPADPAARTFYFELLSLNGELERASRQLEILSTLNGEWQSGAALYQGAIAAEQERNKFFSGGPRPRLLSEPPYAKFYLEAIEHYASGNLAATAELLELAAGESCSLRGSLNGIEIHELSDSHDLLAPFLEIVMDNHYSWVPWEAIQSLSVPQPQYLRDTIWAPASLQLRSGDHGEVLILSLYPSSYLQADDIKLGRRTEWDTTSGFTVAYGQKVVTADDNDYPILELRDLEVEPCPLAA